MKNIKFLLLIVTATLLFWSCGEETLDSKSIFEDKEQAMTDFDKWLYDNYTVPYNIEFKYRFDEKESNTTYNLAPARLDKSQALAKLVKHLWIGVYDELLGKEFLAQYSPRIFNLIGSPAYNTQGSIILGTAEGGLKVTLYNVNMIDVENPDIDQLNFWFFKTMHHEFAHILHQTKSYTTDFNLISATNYQSGSWVNIGDEEALQMGFVTPYGSSESQEDFVELLSVYITNTEDYWQSILEIAGDDGSAIIMQKFHIVEDYLKSSWNIDITELREIVLRRSADVETMDLTTLD
ncbi:MAG: putative zinc-binding metallopeptidase [Sphaerochaetaceae bacterium]|nr:putative zinc-binding metallopeptidase [Sphaerochaetaceae bacterium]